MPLEALSSDLARKPRLLIEFSERAFDRRELGLHLNGQVDARCRVEGKNVERTSLAKLRIGDLHFNVPASASEEFGNLADQCCVVLVKQAVQRTAAPSDISTTRAASKAASVLSTSATDKLETWPRSIIEIVCCEQPTLSARSSWRQLRRRLRERTILPSLWPPIEPSSVPRIGPDLWPTYRPIYEAPRRTFAWQFRG